MSTTWQFIISVVIILLSGSTVVAIVNWLRIKTKLRIVHNQGVTSDINTIGQELLLRKSLMTNLVELQNKAEELLRESVDLKTKIAALEVEQNRLLNLLETYQKENQDLRVENIRLKSEVDLLNRKK